MTRQSKSVEQIVADGLNHATTVMVIDVGPNDDEVWDRFGEAARAVLGALDEAGYEVRQKPPFRVTGTGSYTVRVDAP